MAIGDFLTNIFGFDAKDRRKAPPMKNIGSLGTGIIGGWITEKEKSPDLQGSKRYVTYSNIIANASIVMAGINIFLAFVGKSKWKINPASDVSEHVELAEFMQEVIHDMETPWSRTVRKMALYKYFGFSILEWTAKKREDGRIGLLDISSRPQWTIERWDINENGHLLGVTQRNPISQEEVYLPKSKTIYLVEDAITDDPRGMGLLRSLVYTYKRLEDYCRLEQIGFETDMRGIPVLMAPLGEIEQAVKNSSLSNEDAETLKSSLRNIIENHARSTKSGLLLPSEQFEARGDTGSSPSGLRKYDFQLVSGTHYGHADLGEAINRVQKEMARTLGVEQLLLGESSSGSLALSRDKSKNFSDTVNAILEVISQIVNKDIIDPIWNLNGFDKESKPTSSYEKVEQRDVEQISQVLADLSRVGVVVHPQDEAVGEIFDQLGLTRMDSELLEDLKPETYLSVTKPPPKREMENTDDTEDSLNLPENQKPNGEVKERSNRAN